MLYNVNDKPKNQQIVVFAFQQLLAILAATIAVPSIVNSVTGATMDIAAALFGAGVGTIVYLLFTKSKSPVFLGSSFAFLGPLYTAVTYGYCGVILGTIFAGAVYIAIAVVVKFFGTKWIQKLMPPVVIGPTVALIGLSLAQAAVNDLTKATGSNQGYNLIAILCGLVTFFVVVICSTQKRFKGMRMVPFIIGIGCGYVVAALFSAIGYAAKVDYLKIIDWTPLVENFVKDGAFVGVTAFLDYPNLAIINAIKELATGEVQTGVGQLLNGQGVAAVALAFIPVALVVFAEHIADHKNLGSIIEKELVEGNDPGLSRTLLGDGVGSIAGTIFGVCPNTTYGESVGCVAITRNASIVTIWTTAIMALVISFFSPFIAILSTIPNCVMGGVCLSLYGFIAVSGLKMLKEVDLGDNRNLFVVSVILIAGIGGLAINIPIAKEGLAPDGNGNGYIAIENIATALILGIIVNVVLSAIEKIKSKNENADEDEIEAENAQQLIK